MTGLRPAGVVFDMDDTLFREREYVISGYTAVAARLTGILGVPVPDLLAQLSKIFDTAERSTAFNALLARHGREDLVEICVETYRHHLPAIHLTPEAEVALCSCLRHGPVGLVSDGPELMQATKVAALRLQERGVLIVLTDRLGGRSAWKPSPVGLTEAARRMQLPPSKLVYVADNPLKDFLAARRAGMGSVRYRASWQLHSDLEPVPDAAPSVEIDSLARLPELLGIVSCQDLTRHPDPAREAQPEASVASEYRGALPPDRREDCTRQ